jgi:DNA segregation ATPase FtsK/SpoIIIE, S-DNA-T family
MPLVNIKRIIHPSLVQNDKDSSHCLRSLPREQVKALLSAPLAGGGVFGLEAHHNHEADSLIFFAPPYHKVDWEQGERDPIFEQLHQHKKDISIVQLYTRKSSLFPLSMQHPHSFWEHLRNLCPEHMGVIYQVALAYRHDNWKERLQEQYEDYLNGIEVPSEANFMRRIQRRMNETLDNFLKWDFRYADIPEVDSKLMENGFRYSIRLAFYGGSKHERRKLVGAVQKLLKDMSYMNEWNSNTSFLFDDIIQNIKRRKIDNIGKHHVLTVSELLPFLMSESVVHIEEPTVVANPKRLPAKSPFHLLPIGSKIKKNDGTGIAKKFIYALQELGKISEEIVAKRTNNGPTMMKVTFELPKGLKLSDLTKKSMVEDIQTHMGIKNLRIMQGEEVGEIDVMLPQEERQKIFLRDYVDTPEFMEYESKYPLPIFVGVDEIGRPIFKCLSKIRHILVAGTTGSGKSVWMNQLILTLLLIRSPEELQFYMIDVKQVELPVYEGFPHVHPVITDAKEAIGVLKQLIAEMHQRYSLFKEAGVKNIGLYNKKCPDDKLPYLVCVIDEYAELALQTTEVHDLVQSMSQLARAAGIHLVIATQDPRVDVIPGIIKSNLPGKIGFRCSNANSYMTFLNTKPPFNLLGNGDGTMSFEGQMEEHIRFQGCLIIDDPHDDDLESELIRSIAESMDSFKVRELPPVEEDEEIVEIAEIDRLKKIIATTGETRVSQLRELMKININRLNDLMKELVEEGWFSKPETKQSGYQLIVSTEELEKWRE